jgi:SAM-dependent methyltransferase
MPNEMTKATTRRLRDWRYKERWFVGRGLDVGCGYDIMNIREFPKAEHVTGYDHVLGNTDATTLPEYPESGIFDFVVSSHCLEHITLPEMAVHNWLRVLKRGGFLIVTVPEWELYEHKIWPSAYNGDHKWAWTLRSEIEPNGDKHPEHVIYLLDWLRKFTVTCDLEMLQLLTEYYNPDAGLIDQTAGPAECAIEFVLRKT